MKLKQGRQLKTRTIMLPELRTSWQVSATKSEKKQMTKLYQFVTNHLKPNWQYQPIGNMQFEFYLLHKAIIYDSLVIFSKTNCTKESFKTGPWQQKEHFLFYFKMKIRPCTKISKKNYSFSFLQPMRLATDKVQLILTLL